jgi:WD40 repeat protein
LRWLRVGRGSARPLQVPALKAGFTTDGGTHLRVVSTSASRLIDIRSGRDVVAPVPNPRDLSQRWVDPWLAPGARFLVVPDRERGWESWDYGIGEQPRVVRLDDNPAVSFYSFSPEGNFDAFLGPNAREIGVWNLATGRLVGPKISRGDDSPSFWSTRVGAEGRVLTTGTDKGFVALWETSTGRLLTRFDVSGRGTPNLVNLSPDGRRVAVATTFGEAQVFEVGSGRAVSPVFEVAPSGVRVTESAGAFFSPDGHWLATVESRGTRLRDAVTFSPVGDLIPVDPNFPDVMFFNRDGTRLCVVLGLFDVPSGELITDPPEDTNLPGGILYPSFSPDGNYLCNMVTVASERVCRVRSVPPPARGARVPEWLLQLTTNIAGREIDEAEQSVAVPASRLQLENVRRELAALPAAAAYAEWGRWILDDRPDRPIAPGFAVTPADADGLAQGRVLDPKHGNP